MERHTRRSYLKLATGLVGIATTPAITAASESNRFLIDRKSISDRELREANLTTVSDLSEIDVIIVEGDEAEVKQLDAAFAPDIEYEVAAPKTAATVSGSSEPDQEPSLTDYQWDKDVQQLEDAHAVARGAGTRVAVLDTGIDDSHPDLAHAVNPDLSRDFTGDGNGAPGPHGGAHGTHVAGIIAANDQTDGGTVGSAPAAELVDCRTFSTEAPTTFGMILAAIVYSANIQADIANLSLGAYPVSRPEIGRFYGRLMNRTTSYAKRRGTLLVAAAGNQSADLQHDGHYIALPGEAANVMCVSATGPIGNRWGADGLREGYRSPAHYTNYGTNAIDIAAPGGDFDQDAIGTDRPWHRDLVLNTVPGGYQYMAGTSMAAPQVTGGAALVQSQRQDAPPSQIKSALEEAAEDVGANAYYGAGFINLIDALDH